MAFTRRLPGPALVALVALALTVVVPAQRALAASFAPSIGRAASAADVRPACAWPPAPGTSACQTLIRTSVAQKTPAQLAGQTPSGFGYGPADLQSAYNLPSSTAGQEQEVAIVDAYDDPNAAADLAAYRAAWGLPPCGFPTVVSGCLEKLNQNDQPSPLPAAAGDNGWATEESLDIEMVSAICPSCTILLVEANSNSNSDLGTAVDAAVSAGVPVVSNSYSHPEQLGDANLAAAYYNHPGVAITASAGDNGYGTVFPAASGSVTAVGGTTLTRGGGSRGWTETAWSGTGSGCSIFFSKSSWQTDPGCGRRTMVDVSAVADPGTGVAIYDTYDQRGWLEVGGTSVSAPIIASVYALARMLAPGSNPASYPYEHSAGLNDVTSGSNGTCSPAYLCTAGLFYDGPTGLGTPNGITAFTSSGSIGRRVGATAETADGRLVVFAVGTDGAVWQDDQTAPGGPWSGWASLGGPPNGGATGSAFATSLAAEQNADGSLDVFVRSPDGLVWQDQSSVDGGTWTGWSGLGSPGGTGSGAPAVGRNADGRLQIFAYGAGGINEDYQLSPGGAWSGWASLGGPAGGGGSDSTPAVGQNADGRLELLGGAAHQSPMDNSQTTPGGGWNGWTSLGGTNWTSSPIVSENADGRLQVFGSQQGVLTTSSQIVPGGTWSGWTGLGAPDGIAGNPAVGQDSDGRFEIFFADATGTIWHAAQTTPGGAWSNWTSLGGAPGVQLANPTIGRNADGRLEVFASSSDITGTTWHAFQTTPGGAWSAWGSL